MAEEEYLWAFGQKIPKSKVARIPLNMEPPEDSEPDIFNDDYWRWVRKRMPKLEGLLRIEELSKRLQTEAD
jgi:hypothetical protein